MIGLDDIRQARTRIASALNQTPCLRSHALAERLGCDLFLKYETLQRTGSFKPRGALNTLLSLSDAERARGVIAASAGNHAQGVAFAASSIGVRSTIVMPEITPLIKISRTRQLGAEVVLHGSDYAGALARAYELRDERGHTFVHGFDDERVIAGQGTVGLEIVEQVPDLEAVVVPIGGGGLVAGVATAVKTLRPEVSVYGVQTEAAPAMKRSLEEGRLVECESSRSLADGIAIRHPGRLPFEHVRRYVDDVRLVSEWDIEMAIFTLLEVGKVLTEGAGAAGFAALLGGRIPELQGKRVVVVLCGANIDLTILQRIIERSFVRRHRLIRLRITIPDRPGGLAGLLEKIGAAEANVVRVQHHRVFTDSPFWQVEVEVTLETRDENHIRALLAALGAAGYDRVREVS